MKIGDLPDITAFNAEGLIPMEISGSTRKITADVFIRFGIALLSANSYQGIFSTTDSNSKFKITSSNMRRFTSIAQLKFVAQTQSEITVASDGSAEGVTNGTPIGTIKSGSSYRPALETVAIAYDRQGPLAFCSIGTDGVVRLYSFASHQATIPAYTNLTFVATYIAV